MSEHHEQVALMEWAAYQENIWPELAMLHAVPNGGDRHAAVGAKMKAEGAKAGVPDLDLPVARGCYHGLRIEMKFGKNKTSAEQKAWLAALEREGHATAVCYDWEAARDVILNYLALGPFQWEVNG